MTDEQIEPIAADPKNIDYSIPVDQLPPLKETRSCYAERDLSLAGEFSRERRRREELRGVGDETVTVRGSDLINLLHAVDESLARTLYQPLCQAAAPLRRAVKESRSYTDSETRRNLGGSKQIEV